MAGAGAGKNFSTGDIYRMLAEKYGWSFHEISKMTIPQVSIAFDSDKSSSGKVSGLTRREAMELKKRIAQ